MVYTGRHMSNIPENIAQKLWSLCHILRDDGITYHEYVTELTYLLFLKMAKETGTERQLPVGFRWDNIVEREGTQRLNFYKVLLRELAKKGSRRVQDIYADANTSLREPKNLTVLIAAIDDVDWYSLGKENLGDLYEGLLEKNASELKSGAGQYFTPRPLVECMVSLVDPQPGEVIQDPAAGTGGFLIFADRHIKQRTSARCNTMKHLKQAQKQSAFLGVELVPNTRRLGIMNLMLHDIKGDILLGDAMSSLGSDLHKADVILTNPPFGTKKGGGKPTRQDFIFTTSNKQIAFVEHCYSGLNPGGRCAVVVPDNVLFEDSIGRDLRADLMDKCDLHTILRLPTGIFYAQGVKTNVLFFTRGHRHKHQTKAVWLYDMRTNVSSLGKRSPLTRSHFAEFEACFGRDRHGKAARVDQGEKGRFRRFTRAEISARNDNLDITWLKEEGAAAGELTSTEFLTQEILTKLRLALGQTEEIIDMLGHAQ